MFGVHGKDAARTLLVARILGINCKFTGRVHGPIEQKTIPNFFRIEIRISSRLEITSHDVFSVGWIKL